MRLAGGLSARLVSQPRLAIDRDRPPVQNPFPGVRRQPAGVVEHRFEHVRGGAVRFIEVECLAESDDELGALTRIELQRIEPAEPLARAHQVFCRAAFAEPLEICARRNQVRSIRQLGSQPGALGRADRRLELPLVVEGPCFGPRGRVLSAAETADPVARSKQNVSGTTHPGEW